MLEDVLDHLSCDVLLGQHESLDQLLLGLEDRLLSHDFLDLPFGDLPRAVLVLLVHVTVLVAMLHSLVLLFASGGASSSPAACPLSDFRPVTRGLVSAAATAAARFARPAALAGDGFIFWVFGVFGAFRLLVVFIFRRFLFYFRELSIIDKVLGAGVHNAVFFGAIPGNFPSTARCNGFPV